MTAIEALKATYQKRCIEMVETVLLQAFEDYGIFAPEGKLSSGEIVDAVLKVLADDCHRVHAYECPAWHTGKAHGPCTCGPKAWTLNVEVPE